MNLMNSLNIIFFILLFSVFYTYLIYPALLFVINLFKNSTRITIPEDAYPTLTLFVTAFNEADYVDRKVNNSLKLHYPKDKLTHVWVTDGSTDGTPDLLSKYPEINVFHENGRQGKIHAMKRGMNFVTSNIVVFCDANTLLNENALIAIANSFNNPKVGCVAGEKRIKQGSRENAVTSGEGLYWKYESWVKKLDSKFNSCIGAAGELFAIRRELFTTVDKDTILDDFVISLQIAMKGYTIQYCPEAYACEEASASINDEMKRKVRIAAGSFQAIGKLRKLMNLFKHPKLSFQFISHKLFRWIIVPLSLVLLIPINLILIINSSNQVIYTSIFIIQMIMYLMVFFGFWFQKKRIGWGVFFAPYYFFMANLAMWLGFFRFLKGKQSVQWEKAKRNEIIT